MSENIPLVQGDSPRQQSSLGKSIPERQMRTMLSSSLTFGTVRNVDYTTGRAVVSVTDPRYANSATTVQGAIVPVDFYNYNISGKPYGQYRPIATGTRVLLGYLNKNLATPIILGIYPDDTSNMKQISPSGNVNDTDYDISTRDRALTQKTVYPSQQLELLTPSGTYFRTYNSGSLIKVSTDDKMSDPTYSGQFDPYIRSQDNTHSVYEVPSDPQNMLLLHQSSNDDTSHRTRLFVGKDGHIEGVLTDPQDTSKVVSINISKENGMEFTFQHDTDDIQTDTSTKYTKFSLTKDNDLSIIARDGTTKGTLDVTSTGTLVDGMAIADDEVVKRLSAQLTSMNLIVSGLNSSINSIGGSSYIQDLPTKFNSLTRDTSELFSRMNTAESLGKVNQQGINDMSDKFDRTYLNLQRSYNDLQASIKNLQSNLNNTQGSLLQLTELQKTVDSINETYPEVIKLMADKDKLLTTDSKEYTDMATALTTATADLKTANDTIKTLTDKNKTIIDLLKQIAEKDGVTVPTDL